MNGQNTSETNAALIHLSRTYPLGYVIDGTRGHAVVEGRGVWRKSIWLFLCGELGSKREGVNFDPNHPKACKRCVVSAQRRER